MASVKSAWQVAPEGLISNGALVSFQRFLCPAERIVRQAPASCGVLPVARGDRGFLLAVPSGEAFWIGVLISPDYGRELKLGVQRADHMIIPLARYRGSGVFAIDGIRRPDASFDALCRDTVLRVQLDDGVAFTWVDTASVEDFVVQTGQEPPAPFDLGAAYGGWRLP